MKRRLIVHIRHFDKHVPVCSPPRTGWDSPSVTWSWHESSCSRCRSWYRNRPAAWNRLMEVRQVELPGFTEAVR